MDPNETCILFPSEPDKCATIILIKRINASVSTICCIIMFFMLWFFKFYQHFPYRLVVYLTVAIFFDCIIYLLGEPQNDSPACAFEGFWLTYSDWNVVLWIVCITAYLFLSVVKSVSTERYEAAYAGFAFALPLLPALLPFAGHAYGPAGAWCWITQTGWRMAVWFVPVLLLLLCTLGVYVAILLRIRKRTNTWSGIYGDPEQSEASAQQQQQEIYPLLAFPCVFLAINVLPFVNRINNAVSDTPSYPLYILSALCSPLVGTLNLLLFYLNPAVRKRATASAFLMRLQGGARAESTVREYRPEEQNQGPDMRFSRFQNEA